MGLYMDFLWWFIWICLVGLDMYIGDLYGIEWDMWTYVFFPQNSVLLGVLNAFLRCPA